MKVLPSSNSFTMLLDRMLFLSFVLCLFSCQPDQSGNQEIALSDVSIAKAGKKKYQLDKAYWYAGAAEISTFDIDQNRYNALHNGEQVMIYVTEDFLTDKQVKNDNYTNKNSTSVLKTNIVRRFTTGLYDYSMMTSVFTRADGSGTEKVTLSSQDWCGQSFIQLNKKGGKYQGQLRSYFESEGDRSFSVKGELLEDEIYNLIRISPELIPEGEVSILPSLVSLRFTHDNHVSQKAVIIKGKYSGDVFKGDNLVEVFIKYESVPREVRIVYENDDVRKIKGFEEIRPSGFDKEKRQTQGVVKATIQEPYWKMNQLGDTTRRSPLGLQLY